MPSEKEFDCTQGSVSVGTSTGEKNLHRAFEDDVDVWMVIGRPNVMKLLIRRLPRIGHSYNIQDPLRAGSLYNTLLRNGTPVFIQDLRLYATKNTSSNPVYNPKRNPFES